MADDKAAKEVQERNADFRVLFCFMLFVFFLESANHFNDFLDEKRTIRRGRQDLDLFAKRFYFSFDFVEPLR